MDAARRTEALGALLRMLATRFPGAEAAIYAVDGPRARLRGRSNGPPVEIGWRALDEALAAQLDGPGWIEIDPAAIGRAERYGAAQPLRQAGGVAGFLLLVAPRRPRRTLDVGRALTDAAQVAGPLLAPRAASAPDAGGRDLAGELAAATAGGRMRLVYQPYVDLADGRVTGAEALLRWPHPTRGELPPASFIPLAETTGLILPLGAWALAAALRAAALWPRTMRVSVNVSALQFHDPGFVADVEAALDAADVHPGRLELEITETVLMRDDSQTKARLDALIARGVRIALDDFGTGYSALAYLSRLPHHRIKLDRAFVHDLGNPATSEIVRAIIALARRGGISVTAEGVERAEQIAAVRRLGFTHGQGFAFAAPMADPFAALPAGTGAAP